MLSREAIRNLPFPRESDITSCASSSIAWALQVFGEEYSVQDIDQVSGRSPGQPTDSLEMLRAVEWMVGKGFIVHEVVAPHLLSGVSYQEGDSAETREYQEIRERLLAQKRHDFSEVLFVGQALKRALRNSVVLVPVRGIVDGHTVAAAGLFTGNTTSLFDPACPSLTWPSIASVISRFKAEHRRRGWPAVAIYK